MKLTNEEKKELSAIRKAMFDCDYDFVDKHWDRYLALEAIEAEEYREENQDEFDAFYNKHIKGRRWEDIDCEAWDFYSDWHKEMYGFRPKVI